MALTSVSVLPVPLPCKRLVFSPTGPLDRDYDDVRRFADAATAGVKRALGAGSKHPLLIVQGTMPGRKAEEVELSALLAGLAALYVPLEIRDLGPERSSKVQGLGWGGSANIIEEATALETGKIVCRDIGGSDPERTAAPRVQGLVKGAKLCFRNPYFYFQHGESTSTASQLTSPASQKSKDLNKVSLLLQDLALDNKSNLGLLLYTYCPPTK